VTAYHSAGVTPGSGRTAASAAAGWLHLAAAPVFAAMALLSGLSGADLPEGLCLTAQGASPLTGMVTMYALMSAFHAGPWLELIARAGNAGRRRD